MNNDDKDVVVLGTLKKEKSSKPIFVIVVFVILIGSCLAFPYIKTYFGDDFTLNDLLNRDNNVTTSPIISSSTTTTKTTNITTTSTITTTKTTTTKLICTYRTYEYIYTFDGEKSLTKIENNYSYTGDDLTIYNDTLSNYQVKSNNINSFGGKSTITTNGNNSFKFNAIIDKEIDFKSIDTNYYQLKTKYDIISSELIKKGFDCK